jgi:hypothetical protein
MAVTFQTSTDDFIIKSDVGELIRRTDGIYEECLVTGTPTWISIIFENDISLNQVIYMADTNGGVMRDELKEFEGL